MATTCLSQCGNGCGTACSKGCADRCGKSCGSTKQIFGATSQQRYKRGLANGH